MDSESRPRRVLIVVNHAGFFLSHRLPIALEARARGYEVHIATPASRHVAKIIETGLPWHPIRLGRASTAPHLEIRSVVDMMRLYRRIRPDLVHHVTIKPVLYGTLAARLTGVPAVVNAVTGLGHVFAPDEGSPMLARAIRLAYRALLRHGNMRVIFQNVEQHDIFVADGLVRANQAILIRGSGVDTQVFAPRPRQAGVITIGLVARMIATKGIAEFVGAAKLLRDKGVVARFVLIGEPDPDNPVSIPAAQLERWAAEGAVEYWGRCEEMPEVLARLDMVCLPSYYPEGVPKSLIEAAAAGLPIVTTDIPGCRDIVKDGENGLLVPYRDIPALASALRTFIDDAAFRASAGARGRERAFDLFSLRRVLGNTMAVYADLLS